MERIGFIGLGIMGAGMVRNLLRCGHDVVVWNRTAARMDALTALGATPAGSATEVAQECSIIMICVSDTPDVEEVVEGTDGLLVGLRPGTLVIDHSTISPSTTVRLAARVEAIGGSWMDGPVSGGSEGAANGTLSIMLGGSEANLERARPYLEAFGSTITHVGGIGDGQKVKIVNQILCVVTQLAVSEALLFAEVAGLDLDKTMAAVRGGAAGSWMLANRGPQMAVRDWRPGFTIDLQQKDLRLALEAADEVGSPLPATAIVFQMYRALQRDGLGHLGNHALVMALERMAGTEMGQSEGPAD